MCLCDALQLEEVLMMADIGAATTGEIIDDLRRVAREEQLEPDDAKSVLRGKLIEVLSARDRSMRITKAKQEEQALKQFEGDMAAVDVWNMFVLAFTFLIVEREA